MDFKGKKILIVTHRDGDGIASAAIFSIMLKKLGNFPTAITSPQHVGFDKTVKERIKEYKPDLIVSLDVPIQSIEDVGIPMLVIDHHPYKGKVGDWEIFHDTKHCAAYLTYKYCSKFANIESASWICALGCLSDKDESGFKEIKSIYSKFYPMLKDEQLQSMVSFIASTKIFGEKGINYGINSLIEAESMSMPTTIFGSTPNSQKLMRLKRLSQKERDYWLLFHKDFVKIENKIMYYPIKSKFPIESYVAGTLVNFYPNLICIVSNNFVDGDLSIEGRTKLDVNLGEIFSTVCKKVGGFGGGLKNAAGARIPREKEDEFLEEIKKIM